MAKNLSVCILHHPKRAHLLPYLKEKLGADVPVCIDKHNNLLVNSRRAWAGYDPGADFHLVLDDDAIIGSHFYERVNSILTSTECAYSLYWGGLEASPVELLKGCKVWHVIRWGVAIILPTKYITEMLEYTATIQRMPENRAFDTRISMYCEYRHIPVYYPLPCFVDHNSNEPSLAGNFGRGRKSKYFIGE
jgi:hypothetical protein